MRVEPICKYVSSHMQTAVSLCDSNGTLLQQYLPQKNFRNFIFDDPFILNSLIENTEKSYPVFTFINADICYAHFSINDGIYIIGPFHFLFSDNAIHARFKPPTDSTV